MPRLGVISIHSSHTGRDAYDAQRPAVLDISIHSSHTGRDPLGSVSTLAHRISIHSSHTGRDLRVRLDEVADGGFQSTLPIREETIDLIFRDAHALISIHSSHTGRDSVEHGP